MASKYRLLPEQPSHDGAQEVARGAAAVSSNLALKHVA